MYKIIIADDHPIFRSGIREVIKSLPFVEWKGEAQNGMEAYQLILATQPDVAILDLEMPLLTGLDVCKKVLSEKHQTKFIILTMHKEKHFFEEAMEAGVMGYLLKDNAVEELVKCIEMVRMNQKYISPQIENFLIERQGKMADEHITQVLKQLTSTEKVLIKLISQGKTSPEIAQHLFLSVSTIENHRYNISKKLQLEGKNSLLKFAILYKESLS
jgi:DNA-binding NarL/FixJ family response regulator